MRHWLLGRLAGLAAVALVAAACGGEDLERPATSAAAPATTIVRVDTTATTTSLPTAAAQVGTPTTRTAPTTSAARDEDVDDTRSGIAPLVEEFEPGATPPLVDFDVERLLEAATTLDPEAECPIPVLPESLDGVAEVLRIDGGCDIIEYVQLEGRTVKQVRDELFASRPDRSRGGFAAHRIARLFGSRLG